MSSAGEEGVIENQLMNPYFFGNMFFQVFVFYTEDYNKNSKKN